MAAADRVYLNGQFLPLAEAKVSVLDRGFIFGDGVYEVIPVYGGRPFRLHHHLQRLDRSLQAIHLSNPLSHQKWEEILRELIDSHGGGEQSLYIQITRGVAERDHAFPQEAKPTVFAMSSLLEQKREQQPTTVSAITVEDIRWDLCHIKAITLLPNILLRQRAVESGADEAIMLREGEVTEGTASNIFVVIDGTVATPPASSLLLPGVTRDLVVELCLRHAIPCEERRIDAEQLREAEEVWLTSSSREIMAVTRLDQLTVANGHPGPIWQQLNEHYRRYKQAFREGREA